MALLLILACMGTAYTLSTNSPRPVRQFELTAVWSTLGFIALALLSEVEPAIGLAIAAALATPLWYLTLSVSDQHARAEAQDTTALWRQWRASTGARYDQGTSNIAGRPSLAARLNHQVDGEVTEEIEITQIPEALRGQELPAPLKNLELAPVEELLYVRRRV